jgi:hypothetical protein
VKGKQMKNSTVKLIEERFNKEVIDIEREIRKNKYEINKLAERQKQLKDTRNG